MALTVLVGKFAFGSLGQSWAFGGGAIFLKPEPLITGSNKALTVNFALRADIQDDGVWFFKYPQDFFGGSNLNPRKVADRQWTPCDGAEKSLSGACQKHCEEDSNPERRNLEREGHYKYQKRGLAEEPRFVGRG